MAAGAMVRALLELAPGKRPPLEAARARATVPARGVQPYIHQTIQHNNIGNINPMPGTHYTSLDSD